MSIELTHGKQISGDGEEKIINIPYQFRTNSTTASEILSFIPQKNSPNNRTDDGGFFRDYQINFMPGYSKIILKYSSYNSEGGYETRKNGDSEYELTVSPLNKPLEDNPNYRASWNYALLAKTGVTASPAFWLTATNTELSETDSNSYQWVKDYSLIPSGWYKLLSPLKQGVESWLAPSPVVRNRRFYRKKSKADIIAKQSTVGTLNDPPDLFGYASGKWLITGTNELFDGEFWVVEIEYTFSTTGWDEDIYS